MTATGRQGAAVAATRLGALALAVGLAGAVATATAGHCGLAMPDAACLGAALEGWGAAGPVALVLMLGAAIIFSPIPSGPIAVAAGMIYGPAGGAALVILGALLGALAAFGLGGMVGEGAARTGAVPGLAWLARPRSQGRLMALIFASRLVPFISFDAVSYAAGMTCLAPWRFALATLAGVAPVSLVLAWAGGDLLADHGLPAALVLCGITAVPLGLPALRRAARWPRRFALPRRRGGH